MQFSKKIRVVEKAVRDLEAVKFTVAETKTGASVKFGEKFNILETADKKIAAAIAEDLNLVVATNVGQMKKSLADLQKGFEGLPLLDDNE